MRSILGSLFRDLHFSTGVPTLHTCPTLLHFWYPPCSDNYSISEVRKLTHFSTPKMDTNIIIFGVPAESIFGTVFQNRRQGTGGTQNEAESNTYAIWGPRFGNESPKKWTPKWTLKWVRFEVHFRYRFEDPKSDQNRSILDPFWRSKKEIFWGPFRQKVWTRVPTGSTFPKPIRIRNGKRVEIKELPSTLAKVFEDDERR